MKPEMRDPRLYSDLERRLKYLEAMVEHNFKDNGRLQRELGNLKFAKSHQGSVTTISGHAKVSVPKVRVVEIKVPTNEIMAAVQMQDSRQFELSKRLNRAERRITEIEKEFD